MRAIVDGDEYLYRACGACYQEADYGDIVIPWTPLADIQNMLVEMFEGLKERIKVDELVMALSGPGELNFRREIWPTYKGNRENVRKPLAYYKAEAWLEREYECIRYPRVEADDVMGHHSPDFDWIVSQDKDLKTIAGMHYSPYHDDAYETDHEESDWHWMMQTLIGDPTDGFPGCPGVGAKTAPKLIASVVGVDRRIPSEAFPAVWDEVVAAFGNEEDALTQARCARILRPGEISETGEPQFWTPQS